jgi:NAD-dependent SIR2 family protein deacetylase
MKKGGYFVFTSNVDGQFQKAGYDEKRIVEIHGSIHHLQCVQPCNDHIWSADGVDVKVDMEKFEAEDPLPSCPYCGGLARPNILMFGDWEWIPHRTSGQEFRLDRWLTGLDDKGYQLVVIEIGAGKAVPTVRLFSERVKDRLFGTLIRINPRDYDTPSGRDISIPLGGLEGIRAITEGTI